MDKFVNAEADLPVILRAHNEETRVLKMKIRQVCVIILHIVVVLQHCRTLSLQPFVVSCVEQSAFTAPYLLWLVTSFKCSVDLGPGEQ